MQQVGQIEESQKDVILQALDHILAEVKWLQDQGILIQDSNQQNLDPALERPIEEEEFFGMWADREDMKNCTSREWLEEQRRQRWKLWKQRSSNKQASDPKTRRAIEEAEYFGMWADREDMKGKTSQEWLDELRKEQWERHERT